MPTPRSFLLVVTFGFLNSVNLAVAGTNITSDTIQIATLLETKRSAALSLVTAVNTESLANLYSHIVPVASDRNVSLAAKVGPSMAGFEVTIEDSWINISGPVINLTGGTTAKPTFRPTVPGTYVFNLVVNDRLNSSAPASVRITVPKLGDVDVDGDVDLIDLAKITAMVTKKANGPNDLRDLNGDGRIDLKDLHMFPKLCTRPPCLPEKW